MVAFFSSIKLPLVTFKIVALWAVHFLLPWFVLAPWLLKFFGVETDCEQAYVGTSDDALLQLPSKDAGRRVSQAQMNVLPAAPVVMVAPSGVETKVDEKAVEMARRSIVAPQLPPPPS